MDSAHDSLPPCTSPTPPACPQDDYEDPYSSSAAAGGGGGGAYDSSGYGAADGLGGGGGGMMGAAGGRSAGCNVPPTCTLLRCSVLGCVVLL